MRRLFEEIERRGPLPFSDFVEIALYDDDEGFYTTVGSAGRDADFLTSPEIGPLFGAVVARALDGWWTEMGHPDPFVVIDAGAGPGGLARSVLAAQPACAPALRLVLVERSARQRARHGEHLQLEDPSQAFAPDRGDDEEADDEPAAGPRGPIVVSLAAMPRVGRPCVVVANELLDNLPFDLFEHRDGRWREVRVGLEGGTFVEVVVPVTDEPRELLALDGRDGQRAPVQRAAAAWVREALATAGPGGRVVAFDYARRTTAELAARPWTDWLRTYANHTRGSRPLDRVGSYDITVEVAVDQLPTPSAVSTQAGWLRAHGVDELVAEGKRIWEERAAIGDLAALRARSRASEAEALTDPTGPGAFLVLEWLA